ncbi:MAG: lytic transglycosylase domain-containing protein [Bacteroidetes bacterium]|nr:MAG: lytic transglycosylase domain-containing protein [Bacteroidota bacterium]
MKLLSRSIYFLIPLGILFAGMSLGNMEDKQPVQDLRFISGHLSVLDMAPPEGLTFCGARVPLEREDVRLRLEKELEHLLRYPAGIQLTLRRANRYQDQFVQILRSQDIPEDFFYLAIAESNLANQSSPVGAQGFWQFMAPTARQYGLEVSETVDERFHPEKATWAATAYLKDAYEQFGDWALVAASYNMGGSGLSRAMDRQQVEDYFELDLNAETSRYLYRILAYKCLFENPNRYGVTIQRARLYQPIPYSVQLVKKNIPDLASFAASQGVTYETLKTLNPWLTGRSLIADPGKTYEIRFPLVQDLSATELLVDRPAQPETDSLPAATLDPLEVRPPSEASISTSDA